jgi:hypothetical protein
VSDIDRPRLALYVALLAGGVLADTCLAACDRSALVLGD